METPSAPSHVDVARAAAEAVARNSYGKLLAFLAARTNDVAGAEDALSEAFATALTDWPAHGVPENPEAWLMTVARRKLVDLARRMRVRADAINDLHLMAEELAAAQTDGDIPDERLRLMFACAHPAIEPAIRAPLMLQTILGFDAAAIASAFLVAPTTMSQRLVRAKTKIKEARVPFRVPEPDELAGRLDAVLEAIYACFTEGWIDPTGVDPRRRNLSDEGIWLGRLVVSLLPDAAEAVGLLALMLYAEARREARRDEAGAYVPLAEQDTRLWNAHLIGEAESALSRANRLAATGRFQVEAAIQSAHAARKTTGRTDWVAIERLYAVLETLIRSPVVTINRAVALAEAESVTEGLGLLNKVADEARLTTYQPYWAARADLLARAGHVAAAREAYGRAVGLEGDPAVRSFLQGRLNRLA